MGTLHVPIIFLGGMVAIASMANEWYLTARQPDPVFSEDHWRFPQAGLT
jgi:ABC-type transport system involved in cytochrome c biogenesis permease subunit